jgi:hypothetical protein
MENPGKGCVYSSALLKKKKHPLVRQMGKNKSP